MLRATDSSVHRRRLAATFVATILAAAPGTAQAETFKAEYIGYRCSGADVSTSPTSISATCDRTENNIEYEMLLKARADYTSLGAYVEAFNTELGPDHLLRTPLNPSATASMGGTLVVSGGSGAGVLKTAVTSRGPRS